MSIFRPLFGALANANRQLCNTHVTKVTTFANRILRSSVWKTTGFAEGSRRASTSELLTLQLTNTQEGIYYHPTMTLFWKNISKNRQPPRSMIATSRKSSILPQGDQAGQGKQFYVVPNHSNGNILTAASTASTATTTATTTSIGSSHGYSAEGAHRGTHPGHP